MNEELEPRRAGRRPRIRLTDAPMPHAPIREPVREPVRQSHMDEQGKPLRRKRKGNIDQFDIPTHIIPSGWSYEWKRNTVYNEADPAYEVALRENGWRPVPASRHPQYMPADWKGGTIDRGGMRLYERPMELTLEARMEDDDLAREAINIRRRQMGETPAGQLSRDHPSARRVTQVNKQYAPLLSGEIPEDEL